MSEQRAQATQNFDSSRLRIESHRHLINSDIKEMTGVEEYFDTISGKRILTIPRLSENAKIHAELTEKRVPVYTQLAVDERNLLLNVPNDARTIQSNLKFIARDVVHYKEIFSQVGEVLGRCAVSGLGLPEQQVGRTVLGGIAFSLDDAEAFGGNVHLLPPYALNTSLTKVSEFELIQGELVESEHISPAVASELVNAARSGWESVRIS